MNAGRIHQHARRVRYPDLRHPRLWAQPPSTPRARELYADQWLGFSEVQLHQWLEEAGFGKLGVTVVSREKESPHFQTVFATGSK